jgi:bifunctional oligoribonuclease and PAP phosphatase NrnA
LSAMLDEIISKTRAGKRFAITSHRRPDGDSIGSSLALAQALEAIGKSADILMADPVPQSYSTLPGVGRIRSAGKIEGDYDAVFVLDCGDLDRPGLDGLDRYFIINIDHHLETAPFGDLNLVDPSASAVAELVFDLITALGIVPTPDIASNLFVAISTDTGSFQFSNTTAKALDLSGRLVRLGADPGLLAVKIHMSQPPSRLALLGEVLKTLKLHPSGQLAWITLNRETLEETGSEPGDTEGIVNYPLSIGGVSAVAFFREEGENEYRVSLRSKDSVDVAAVARLFGGGGHKNAAGMSLKGTQEEVVREVIERLEEALA